MQKLAAFSLSNKKKKKKIILMEKKLQNCKNIQDAEVNDTIGIQKMINVLYFCIFFDIIVSCQIEMMNILLNNLNK